MQPELITKRDKFVLPTHNLKRVQNRKGLNVTQPFKNIATAEYFKNNYRSGKELYENCTSMAESQRIKALIEPTFDKYPVVIRSEKTWPDENREQYGRLEKSA